MHVGSYSRIPVSTSSVRLCYYIYFVRNVETYFHVPRVLVGGEVLSDGSSASRSDLHMRAVLWGEIGGGGHENSEYGISDIKTAGSGRSDMIHV